MSLISRFINVLRAPQRKQEGQPAERIYQSVLAASRQPELYIEFDVPDNLDSRFDMLCPVSYTHLTLPTIYSV